MPWSQTPKRPFRILVYLIAFATFGLLTRQLFSIITKTTRAPSPPSPVAHDWKANTPSTIISEPPPIPTIIANNVTDSAIKEDYWPQWNTWEKDGWTLGPSDPKQSYLRNLLMYKERGHDSVGIKSLLDQSTLSSAIHAAPVVDVVIRVTDIKKSQPQLEAIVAQKIKPKTMWLITSSSSISTTTTNIISFLNDNNITNINIRTILIPEYDAQDGLSQQQRQDMWLPSIDTTAEWVWILEQDVVPVSSQYLETMLRLMHTSPYENALLGTHGILFPSNFHNTDNDNDNIICLPTTQIPDVSQPVDMIQGSWIMKKEWISLVNNNKPTMQEMQLPLGYVISQRLMKKADVVTISLPPLPSPQSNLLELTNDYNNNNIKCQSIQNVYTQNSEWKRMRALRINPTVLDYRQTTIRKHSYQLDTVLFILDGPDQATAFYPLMCRFGYTIHVIVSGSERGLSGTLLKNTLKQTGCDRHLIVHDLNLMAVPGEGDEDIFAMEMALRVTRLTRVLRPRATFYIQRDNQPLPRALVAMAENEEIVVIGLPADDIIHALWISDLSFDALEQWHTPDINLVVITDRRPHSLSRLLQSSDRSFYLGDKVNLVVHMEQSSDSVTRMLVGNFPWHHGKKTLRHRIRKGGLMPAIIESWYPKNNDDYAVILEDDVSLSPLFYVWAKYSILRYRYSNNNNGSGDEDRLRQMMFGVSLYSPRSLELHPAGRRPFHPDNVLLNHYPPRMPYVSQIPCSWGAVYFPEHWREFHEYLTIRLMDINQDRLLNITVPKSRSERWKKSWKKYFIELVYLRGYVMLYPNFQDFESFSTNHLETGTHVKTNAKRLSAINAFLVPLMQRDTILAQLPNHRLPNYDDLPVLDLWGYLRTHDELDETASQWHTKISTCPRKTGTFDPQDILCPFQLDEAIPEPPKKPKKIKTVYAVEPIEYVTMYYNTHQQKLQQLQEEVDDEYLPQPIDVAVMPSEPDNGSNVWDDHWLDVLNDLVYMNELYNRVNTHYSNEDLRDILTADAELDLD